MPKQYFRDFLNSHQTLEACFGLHTAGSVSWADRAKAAALLLTLAVVVVVVLELPSVYELDNIIGVVKFLER